MDILSNISLAPFTTFGIGGPARWFVQVASEDDILEATAWAHQNQIPLFVLGGGSNLLISDAGFNGLVLHIALRGISTIDTPSHRIYQAAAGEPWDNFVEQTLQNQCSGLECLAGIPGSVGGTPVQNVGAYGLEVSSVIHRVRAFDLHNRIFVEFSAEDCAFSYRRSRFNTADRNRYLVTRVDYRLTPGGPPTLRYADLQREFESAPNPSLTQVATAVRRIRQSKGMLLVEGDPDGRSAGSFFKNPILPLDYFQKIATQTPGQMPSFPADPGLSGEPRVKIPAAWLIEHSGFSKGYTLGPAAISSRHTLALINKSSATAADILALASQIVVAVQARFGVKLEMEPVQLGFQPPHFSTSEGKA